LQGSISLISKKACAKGLLENSDGVLWRVGWSPGEFLGYLLGGETSRLWLALPLAAARLNLLSDRGSAELNLIDSKLGNVSG